MKKYIIFCLIIIILVLTTIGIYKSPYAQKAISYFRIKIFQDSLTKYEQQSENNTVNIVSITDPNYVTPLMVTIYSAIKNKNKNSKYHFFVIGVDLNNYDIENLKKLAEDDAQITVMPTKDIYKFYNLNNDGLHVPTCDFLKFNFPDIFPKFNKILYLDGDILVQKDLNSLYNIDINEYYIGCVQENHIYYPLEEDLNLPKYFNNGVMLLNLKKMRNDNITEKLIRHRMFIASNRFVTQDTFNVVLQPAIKFLDSKYNIPIVDIDINQYSDVNEYLKSGVIIHYAGDGKPWLDSEVIYAAEWQKYYNELQLKYENNIN